MALISFSTRGIGALTECRRRFPPPVLAGSGSRVLLSQKAPLACQILTLRDIHPQIQPQTLGKAIKFGNFHIKATHLPLWGITFSLSAHNHNKNALET
jgi:hypothetical protein